MNADPTPFKTLNSPSGPALYKEKKSKFLGFACPVKSLEEAEAFLAGLRKQYSDATHLCYAYRIGLDQPKIRMNDDGEPTYSAGAPIFGQIESLELFNVLVCVIRYYGGTKLGVGGLIQAYRETAGMALEDGSVITIQPQQALILNFDYPRLDAVMRFVSHHQLSIYRQRMEMNCTLELRLPVKDKERIREGISALGPIEIIEKQV